VFGSGELRGPSYPSVPPPVPWRIQLFWVKNPFTPEVARGDFDGERSRKAETVQAGIYLPAARFCPKKPSENIHCRKGSDEKIPRPLGKIKHPFPPPEDPGGVPGGPAATLPPLHSRVIPRGNTPSFKPVSNFGAGPMLNHIVRVIDRCSRIYVWDRGWESVLGRYSLMVCGNPTRPEYPDAA